jgi:hypothetical protein
MPCILDSHYIPDILYDAYQGTVTPGVAANLANLCIRNIVAFPAVADTTPELLKGTGEGFGLGLRLAQQVQYQSQGGPLSDSRKLGHFLYGLLEQSGRNFHTSKITYLF